MADLEQARQFIALLTGAPDTPVTFQTFDDSAAKRGNLARIFHGHIDQHAASLEMLNQLGAGVFVTINETDGQGRKLQNITGVRAVFVDCDSPEADPLRLIHESDIDPDFIVESSPGKYHAYRRVSGFPPDESVFAGVQLLLADKVQGDPAVKDLTRVMRLPGFNHQKGAPVMARIHEVRHPGRVTDFKVLLPEVGISVDQVRQRACVSPNGQGKNNRVTPNDFMVPLREGDGRDIAATRYAGWLARWGMSPELILDHLRGWNLQHVDALEDKVLVSLAERMHAKEAEKRKGFPLTELGFSERCTHVLSARHRYIADAGCWIDWNGRNWDFDSDCTSIQEGVKRIARSLLDEAAQMDDPYQREGLIKHNAKCENAKTISAAIKLMRSSSAIVTASCELDRHSYLIACDNAIVNLKTGAASSPNPDLYITHRAHVEYDQDAKCPRWEQFVSEVFDGQVEIINYVQKALGYCLTGDTSEEIALICLGSGANGKSTMLNTVKTLMGDYAQRLPSSALMVKRGSSGGEATPALARLRGARLAITSEVATGRQIDEELLKDLVSQDTIAARYLNKNFIEFEPSHKILFALNHLPTIASSDHGTWRRLRVIPFNRTFDGTSKDTGLAEKLQAELPGIFNWLIAGCMAWQQSGLTEPGAVKMRTAEYRTNLDIVGQYLSEACQASPLKACKTGAALLYQGYRRYCEIYGLPWMSARQFGEDLKARGMSKTRTGAGFFYSGVSIRPEWLPDGAVRLAELA